MSNILGYQQSPNQASDPNMITHIAHVNITVPEGTFALADQFYGDTLGLTLTPVPHLQKETLRW